MAKKYLGEFEESILTMVAVLEGQGYGKSIVDSFLSSINRKVSLSAVHITLYRLEDKRFVESFWGGRLLPEEEEEKDYIALQMPVRNCYLMCKETERHFGN
ncbi:MAG: hypothetical protein V3V00_00265 [Saprospiraceae bacterium]